MPELKFKIACDNGTLVYLRTDPDQKPGVIVAIKKNYNGGVEYEINFADGSGDWYQHAEFLEVPAKKKTKAVKEEKDDEDDEENEGDIPK